MVYYGSMSMWAYSDIRGGGEGPRSWRGYLEQGGEISETGKNKKSLKSTFACFSTDIAKV